MTSAVGEAMWSMTRSRVRGVRRCSIAATTWSASAIGYGTAASITAAPCRPHQWRSALRTAL
jgi:hypothetical protein